MISGIHIPDELAPKSRETVLELCARLLRRQAWTIDARKRMDRTIRDGSSEERRKVCRLVLLRFGFAMCIHACDYDVKKINSVFGKFGKPRDELVELRLDETVGSFCKRICEDPAWDISAFMLCLADSDVMPAHVNAIIRYGVVAYGNMCFEGTVDELQSIWGGPIRDIKLCIDRSKSCPTKNPIPKASTPIENPIPKASTPIENLIPKASTPTKNLIPKASTPAKAPRPNPTPHSSLSKNTITSPARGHVPTSHDKTHDKTRHDKTRHDNTRSQDKPVVSRYATPSHRPLSVNMNATSVHGLPKRRWHDTPHHDTPHHDTPLSKRRRLDYAVDMADGVLRNLVPAHS